jgi:sugar transferase EpsL
MVSREESNSVFPYRVLKRIFDLLIASFVLVLGALPLGVVAVLLWSLQRKVLFGQMRPGLHGRPFKLYKFCSMTDERDQKGDLLPDSRRLTRIGSLVRSTSLDELPQFWNVLKGEMSVVGPRPLLMRYMQRYNAEQARRHNVKPGITGWAQVNGRNGIDWDTKFALDVWYVDHQSFSLDLRILRMTFFHLMRRSGISSQGHATMPEFMGGDLDG